MKMVPDLAVSGSGLTFGPVQKMGSEVRGKLLNWVSNMRQERDGEEGAGPDGAGEWLEQQMQLAERNGLFQTFVGLIDDEIVWTGSVVPDDRGARKQLQEAGIKVETFFGLFNTRVELRGRGIGWAGANYAMEHIYKNGSPVVGLFTTNKAAERHYLALGFKQHGLIFLPGLQKWSAFFIYNYHDGGMERPCRPQ